MKTFYALSAVLNVGFRTSHTEGILGRQEKRKPSFDFLWYTLSHTTLREIKELIGGCIGGDASARSEFASRFHRNIAATITKVACRGGYSDPELIKELIQETYLKLLSENAKPLRLLRTVHEGAVAALVQAIAFSVACDYFREKAAQKRGGAVLTVPLDDPATPEIARKDQEREILRNILFSQVDRALSDVLGSSEPSDQRSVFWLYYRHGMTARDIAALPLSGLSIKGIESLLLRLTRGVRERLAGDLEGKTTRIPS